MDHNQLYFDDEDEQNPTSIPLNKMGSNVSTHSFGFRDFLLRPELLRAIIDSGLQQPTQIQHEFIPQAILGMDILCQAKSGMGKTVVFVLATLQQLDPQEGQCSVLVMCQTKEHALQISKEYERFSKNMPALRVSVFFEGMNFPNDMSFRPIQPHIVIGTPGIVLSLIRSQMLSLNHLKHFILDGSDKMLEQLDTKRNIQEVFRFSPREKQVMMFTTCLTKEVRSLYQEFIQDMTLIPTTSTSLFQPHHHLTKENQTISPSNERFPPHMNLPFIQSRIIPALQVNNQSPPTIEHIQALRVFIKHMHSYGNTCPTNISLQDSQFKLTSPFDDIRTVWFHERGLQEKIYFFLRHCFEVWPSDSSFRLPIETWLSYIQPWRYNLSSVSSVRPDDHEDDRTGVVSTEWLPFVVSNIYFYNAMFLQVMERLSRLDFTSSKNAIILFRVMKVYASRNLIDMIRSAETSKSYGDKTHGMSPLKMPLHHHTSRTHFGDSLLKHTFPEHSDETVFLSSQKMIDVVKQVHHQLLLARGLVSAEINSIQEAVKASEARASGFMGFFNSMFDSEDQTCTKNLTELTKTDNFLSTALSRLEVLFTMTSADALTPIVLRMSSDTDTCPLHLPRSFQK